MLLTYLSKSLSVASSTGIGTISSAAPAVIVLNSSQLDTQRRIAVFSSSLTLASAVFTIRGTREGGGVITETLTGLTSVGGTNPVVTTQQDYLSVTSISASSQIERVAIFGTSSQGGTPWHLVSVANNPIVVSAAITLSSSGLAMTGAIDVTLDDPTRTFPNPNFTAPQSFNSTSHVGAPTSTNAWGIVNVDANSNTPITAFRLTMTSTAGATGTVSATVLQSGLA
jgi:hypothetical protein